MLKSNREYSQQSRKLINKDWISFSPQKQLLKSDTVEETNILRHWTSANQVNGPSRDVADEVKSYNQPHLLSLWYQDTEQEGESQGEPSGAAKTEWGFQGVQGAKILRVDYWRRQNCREKQRVENGIPDINRRRWVVSIHVCEETTQHGLKQRKRGTYPWGSTGLRIMWIHISRAEKLRIYGTLGKILRKKLLQ